MDKKEVKPSGDGAKSEIQEPRTPRELDAEIAERVIGEPMPPTPTGCPHFLNTLSPEKAWHHVRDFDRGDGECKWEPEPFSTSIEAAMRVVEKLIDMGGRVSLRGMQCVTQGFADEYKPLWRVNFYRFRRNVPPSTRFSFDSEAESLPEAICRAALALVDGPQERG